MVGLVVQPLTIATYIFLLKSDIENYCSLAKNVMVITMNCTLASFNHLLVMSGERYIAIKHPFAYDSLVTEVRIVIGAGLAWISAIILLVASGFTDINNFSLEKSITIMSVIRAIFVLIMVYFNVAIYKEVRRSDKNIIANQVSLEAKKKLLKNKKTFYITTIVLFVIFLCYVPANVCISIFISFKEKFPGKVGHVGLLVAPLFPILKSLFNPLIYAVRIRYFRVALLQLLSRKTDAQAERLERKMFGPRRIGVEATGQEHENNSVDK